MRQRTTAAFLLSEPACSGVQAPASLLAHAPIMRTVIAVPLQNRPGSAVWHYLHRLRRLLGAWVKFVRVRDLWWRCRELNPGTFGSTHPAETAGKVQTSRGTSRERGS